MKARRNATKLQQDQERTTFMTSGFLQLQFSLQFELHSVITFVCERLLIPSSCSRQINSCALRVHCISDVGKASTVLWSALRVTETGRPLLSVQPLRSVGQKTGFCCARGQGSFVICLNVAQCKHQEALARSCLPLVCCVLLSPGKNPGPSMCSVSHGSTLPHNYTHKSF